MTLVPLASAVHRFETAQGPARTDSFLVDAPDHPSPAFFTRVAELTRALPAPPSTVPWAVRSVYVYRRGPQLDDRYSRTVDELRGGHAAEVVLFARWSNGTLDLLLGIDDSIAVYDALAAAPIDPPWEFR